MRTLYSLTALVVVGLAGAVSAGAQQMQPYTSADGRFTVNFPQGTVATTTDSVPYSDGTKGTMYEFSVSLDNDNLAYMVLYNDYSAAQANGDPQTILQQTRDGAVKGKTLLSDIAINLNGVPGREFTAKDDSWNYTVRQFLSGKRLYQLIIVSNASNPATQTSDFLSSFKIF